MVLSVDEGGGGCPTAAYKEFMNQFKLSCKRIRHVAEKNARETANNDEGLTDLKRANELDTFQRDNAGIVIFFPVFCIFIYLTQTIDSQKRYKTSAASGSHAQRKTLNSLLDSINKEALNIDKGTANIDKEVVSILEDTNNLKNLVPKLRIEVDRQMEFLYQENARIHAETDILKQENTELKAKVEEQKVKIESMNTNAIVRSDSHQYPQGLSSTPSIGNQDKEIKALKNELTEIKHKLDKARQEEFDQWKRAKELDSELQALKTTKSESLN